MVNSWGSKKMIAYVIKNLGARTPKSSDVAVESPVSLCESGLPSRSMSDAADRDEEDFSCVNRSGSEMITLELFLLVALLQDKPKLSNLRKVEVSSISFACNM
ncbi:hypothetical protein A0J61_11807, partial [Choanephora cucurbitarum]